MRAGGVDPARMGKRRKSPKTKSKRSHGQPQSAPEVPQSQPTITETSEMGENVSSDVSTTPGMENSTSEHVTSECLATTPGFGKEEGVIDIAKTFEVHSLLYVFFFFLVEKKK